MSKPRTRKTFHVANGFKLPDDAVTQTYAFLGRKGSGKTYAAGRMVESFLSDDVQCVILDPVGNWHGLRLSADGKKPSKFEIPMLGGMHGDVPLDASAGNVAADWVVNSGSSAVLDVSGFRKADRKRFVTAFAEQLFHRKKTDSYPMHFVLEESQVFVPEQAKGQEAMVGAIEDIVRLGRNYGIGCSMISQRPQSVNKEVLNQAEPLVVFQLVAHHEREAVRKWMQHVGVDDKSALDALPNLNNGECFFWSPAWMRCFHKTRFRKKTTYDASATPKLGDKRKVPPKLGPVDLAALEGTMQQAIEEAKANDPKELKRQIAALQKEVQKLTAQREKQTGVAIKDAERMAREAAKAVYNEFATALAERDEAVRARLESVRKILADIRLAPFNDTKFVGKAVTNALLSQAQGKIDDFVNAALEQVGAPAAARKARENGSTDELQRAVCGTDSEHVEPPAELASVGRMSKAETNVLRALYWLRDRDYKKTTTAFYAGYSQKSSGYGKALTGLRGRGFVDGVRITKAGIDAIMPDAGGDMPSGDTLRSWLRPKLSKAANACLDVLNQAYPDALDFETVCERAGYSGRSSGPEKALGQLRGLGAIEGGKADGYTMSEDLA